MCKLGLEYKTVENKFEFRKKNAVGLKTFWYLMSSYFCLKLQTTSLISRCKLQQTKRMMQPTRLAMLHHHISIFNAILCFKYSNV